MSNPLRDFLRSHPSVVAAGEGFEHVILDALEAFIVGAVKDKLGVVATILPVETIADAGKNFAEHAIDGAVTKFIAEDPAPAPAPSPRARPAALAVDTSSLSPSPSPDQLTRTKQAQAAQRIVGVEHGSEQDIGT